MNDFKVDSGRLVRGRTVNILVVDDRPENLLTLESIIEREGRRIIRASGGNEALRLAIREDIGLILMDIQMPEIDGIEVTRLLRSNSRTRHIPVIFVSAVSGTEKPWMDEFEEGTVDCLSKPLNLEETRNKVAFAEMMYHLRMDRMDALQAAGAIAREHEQFVSKLGHDLKSPMRAIHNLSNWIADDLGNSGNPNIKENLTLLQNRMNRLNTMLDAIVEYDSCGRPMGQVEPVDLGKLVHVVYESLTPPKGFRIEVSDMPVVLTEKARLFKIVHHLLSNAVLHHHHPATGKIVVTCEVSEAYFLIRVADNGPGIRPQHSGKLFDLFGMTHSIEDPGTRGAGLALTKRLVQGMGQHIWLEPGGHGKGSIFCFTLERNGPQNLK